VRLERSILDWLRARGMPALRREELEPKPPPRQRRAMKGTYALLHEYLEKRYANTVVLTFSEIEDLLGFTLPDQARLRQDWWTDVSARAAGQTYSDSWVLAGRTARPNLIAKNVIFERTP
jgi:hypothetical protein